MEKITTIVNEKTARELSKKNQILVIVGVLVGLACIGLYVLISFLNNDWGQIINIIMLVLGCFLIAFSGMLEFGVQKRIILYKKHRYESTYEFFDKYILLQAFRNGEKFQDVKIKYEDLFGYVESKSYISLKLNNGNSLPITKTDGLEELLISKGLTRRRKQLFE